MAGLDDGYTGEARLTPGFTVGYLSQEPQLDPAKDVRGNVMDGVSELQALLDRRPGQAGRSGRLSRCSNAVPASACGSSISGSSRLGGRPSERVHDFQSFSLRGHS